MIDKLKRILFVNVFLRRFLLFSIILIIGLINYVSGRDFSFAIFYLVPIAIAAWYDIPKITILTILTSLLIWLYTDSHSGHEYHHLAPYWNTLVRLIFLSVVAILITKIRGNLSEMTQMAMKDDLTMLNNSRAFQAQYNDLRKKPYLYEQSCALGVIDLDGFKKINDSLGHSRGDHVLIEFASILRAATRRQDIIARMGGDEFIVLLKNIDQKGVEEYAKRLRKVFNESILAQQKGVNFSMGICIYKYLPKDLDQATHKADQLMYKAKAEGKARIVITSETEQLIDSSKSA